MSPVIQSSTLGDLDRRGQWRIIIFTLSRTGTRCSPSHGLLNMRRAPWLCMRAHQQPHLILKRMRWIMGITKMRKKGRCPVLFVCFLFCHEDMINLLMHVGSVSLFVFSLTSCRVLHAHWIKIRLEYILCLSHGYIYVWTGWLQSSSMFLSFE